MEMRRDECRNGQREGGAVGGGGRGVYRQSEEGGRWIYCNG